MKRRLGIFVFYDSKGYVERYVETLLRSLSEYLGELIIVINGIIDDDSFAKLKRFSKKIIIRENIGYDGGAYKDVFVSHLEKSYLSNWDEIILFNDTFYAPLFPWLPVFEKMEKLELDFWGLTECLGYSNFLSNGLPIEWHIQAYFLVCSKRLFLSEVFQGFWEELPYSETYYEAIVNFEMKFSSCMKKAGFKCMSYVSACGRSEWLEYEKNIYLEKSMELMEVLRMPIVKRRVFRLEEYSKSKLLLEYIKDKTDYDESIIIKHLIRLDREGQHNSSIYKLKIFCAKYKNIYIYGHGKMGCAIAECLSDLGLPYKGFIVSNRDGHEEQNVYEYRNINIGKCDGVILGLGKKGSEEVYDSIKDKFEEGQLFLPFI